MPDVNIAQAQMGDHKVTVSAWTERGMVDVTINSNECRSWGQATGFETKYEHVYAYSHECLVLIGGKWTPRDLINANQVQVGK